MLQVQVIYLNSFKHYYLNKSHEKKLSYFSEKKKKVLLNLIKTWALKYLKNWF